MWQLTITQKRMASYGEIDETTIFQSKSLNELSLLLIRLSESECRETVYKLERVKGEENE